MSTTLETIKQIMSENMGVDPGTVTDDGNIFFDFGFDSLDGVELIILVEAEFDVEFPDETMDRDSMTIAELVDLIDRSMAAKAN